MATTTNYSWTTPDDTDLVKDGASAIRTLGSSVDTTVKNLNPETTLGDISYRSSTTNVNTRLALGTAGQVLKVNSGATAPEWGAVPSEKSMLLPQNAGRYIKPYTTVSLTNVTLVEDTTYYFPIYLSGIALDRISLRTANSHTGTSTIRLGLYNANATTGKPDTVFLDAGTVACAAANTNFEITITSTPPAGFYYVAINAQTITGTPIVSASNATNTLPFYFLKTTDTVESVTYLTGYSEGSITGAFATAGSLTVITSVPILTPLRMA
jgi:hypothetical protein